MISRMGGWYRVAFAVAVAAIIAALPERAPAADFYAGKTINFVVGTDIGGGFSIYARAIGKYLTRHIPGNPTVIVKNMRGSRRGDRKCLALPDRSQGRHRDCVGVAECDPGQALRRQPDPIRPDPFSLSGRRGAQHTPVHDLPAART